MPVMSCRTGRWCPALVPDFSVGNDIATRLHRLALSPPLNGILREARDLVPARVDLEAGTWPDGVANGDALFRRGVPFNPHERGFTEANGFFGGTRRFSAT